MNNTIIAIDGEASTGKSTQAKKIAKYLGFIYKDSGAYYRAITYYLLKNKVNPDFLLNKEMFDKIKIEQNFENNINKIFLNGENITDKIRGYKVSVNVSNYAKKPEIRDFVYKQLRQIGEKESIVIDGRDIGTVVFPDAKYKFFLKANSSIRAERRLKEINDVSVELESIKEEIIKRDNIDSTRKIAPLIKADDAVEIDVSYLTIEEVFNKLIEIIKN
ncbi:MAG: (d)CMP kinase [Bacteroidota bacterium]